MARRRDQSIEILVADDEKQFRRVLLAILDAEADMEVVGEAVDGEDALAKAIMLVPDMVLLDVRMPGTGGIHAARAIKEWVPTTKVIMLTSSDEEDDLFTAIRVGASGYLLKEASVVTLAASLRTVMDGEIALSPTMASKLAAEFRDPGANLTPRLSDREVEILQFVSEGHTNSEVAERLYLSAHTIKRHMANILAKLHLRTRVEAVLYAQGQDLLG